MIPLNLTWKSCPFILFSFYNMLDHHVCRERYHICQHYTQIYEYMCHSLLFRQIHGHIKRVPVSNCLEDHGKNKYLLCSTVPTSILSLYPDRAASHINYSTEGFLFLLNIRPVSLKFGHITMKIRLAFRKHNISQTILCLSQVSHTDLKKRQLGRKPCLHRQLFSQCIQPIVAD